MMKSNNPFCSACLESDCVVSLDETCAMIRAYRSASTTASISINDLTCVIDQHLNRVHESNVSSKEKLAVAKSLNALRFGLMLMSKKRHKLRAVTKPAEVARQ
jgi:hypothetical protein